MLFSTLCAKLMPLRSDCSVWWRSDSDCFSSGETEESNLQLLSTLTHAFLTSSADPPSSSSANSPTRWGTQTSRYLFTRSLSLRLVCFPAADDGSDLHTYCTRSLHLVFLHIYICHVFFMFCYWCMMLLVLSAHLGLSSCLESHPRERVREHVASI